MFHRLCKSVVVALFSISILGCTTPTTIMDKHAETVHLRMDSGFNADDCLWLGEVTGSEGHWYSYLFFANDVLIQGALHDIKNRANQLGADTVYMITPQDFATSFTVVGNAYQCHGIITK
ncbi:DUF4156 domain-containing protein [Vibrio scophthalmi]|uniref:Uncharacterized protein n=1 Tax=Vibrio scophthalmi TaxID=45658 RepID=A0A1B1NQX8_9VIBR|nr:DUF4156 domain-containing protein [Vibrio scophthalmi]ANS86088.1 hypothetical protein VSVS12_02327 [Vibrio scophthalmi]ANU35778.1 hypothetical protein VSVS05_00646 [Vibrio scophthalmi]